MSLLSFFEWCEDTAVGHAIRDSLWPFPVIESVHLLALALIGVAILLVDLRLLGLGLRTHRRRRGGRRSNQHNEGETQITHDGTLGCDPGLL